MPFYLYSNKNSVFNYLSRNFIACESIIPEISGNRTISTHCDNFLFVTHKKLSRTAREFGLSTPQEVHPVTLEIENIPRGELSEQEVVLVRFNGQEFQYSLSKWSEYDSSVDVGALVLGAIPLSCISGYLFDNEKEKDSFDRPSPDYWYPHNKFGLLPEGFTEEIQFNISEGDVVEQTGIEIQQLETETRALEKRQAALLNLFNTTQDWQYGKYRLNIDAYLQSIVSINDSDIQERIPNYTQIKNSDNREELDLVNSVYSMDALDNQKLFAIFFDYFVAANYGDQHSSDFFSECFQNALAKIGDQGENTSTIRAIMNEIEMLIRGDSSKSIDEIIARIPPAIDALKALLFVGKNPDNYDHFVNSLEKYQVDVVSARRASVLWSALNGLKGMPGTGHNKDNQRLWQFVEWWSTGRISIPNYSFQVEKPEIISSNGELLGIKLNSEEVITFDEIYATIQADQDKLSTDALEKVAKAAEKKLGKKGFAEGGYLQVFANNDLRQIQKGEVLVAADEAILAALLKCFRAPKLNREKLLQDWVKPNRNFKYVYDQDQEYWKTIYKKHRGT